MFEVFPPAWECGGGSTSGPRAQGREGGCLKLGLLGEGAGGRRGAPALTAPRPSGESRRRLFRDRGWVGPWLAGPSLFSLPLVVSGACGTEGRESRTRASCTGSERDRA